MFGFRRTPSEVKLGSIEHELWNPEVQRKTDATDLGKLVEAGELVGKPTAILE